MSATDELRRLLDEHGVHWWVGEDERKTLWESNGLTWEYFNDENGDAWLGFLGACEQDITPEQAIAATLGSGTCKDVCSSVSEFTCSACGFECDLTSWISLFDGDDGRHRHHHHGTPHYCPNCGRKVVDE